jgi:uncharacterized membrane protein
MPPALFAIFGTLVFGFFAVVSIVLMARPAFYMRRYPNPWMEDTPWTRIQLRAVGLIFSLFVILVVSGVLSGSSNLLDGFSSNINVALFLAFFAAFITGILSWILWRFSSFRIFVRKHYSSEKLEDPAWERRLTVTFCGLLLGIVSIALILAVLGYHPPKGN